MFTGPFEKPVSTFITFTNPTDQKAYIKIEMKATDSRLYYEASYDDVNKLYKFEPIVGVVEPKKTKVIKATYKGNILIDPLKPTNNNVIVQSVFVSTKTKTKQQWLRNESDEIWTKHKFELMMSYVS